MLSHVLSFSLTALTSPWASAELANIAHASNRVLSSRDHSILYTVAHALCTQPPPFNACSELYAALRKHIFSYVHGSVFLNVVHVCMFICMYVCTCDCCLLSLCCIVTFLCVCGIRVQIRCCACYARLLKYVSSLSSYFTLSTPFVPSPLFLFLLLIVISIISIFFLITLLSLAWAVCDE